jgi:hypothetical protein
MLSSNLSRPLRASRAFHVRTFATPAQRIGDRKVSMSQFEPDSYINYQRTEDNLAIVRQRCGGVWRCPCRLYRRGSG